MLDACLAHMCEFTIHVRRRQRVYDYSLTHQLRHIADTVQNIQQCGKIRIGVSANEQLSHFISRTHTHSKPYPYRTHTHSTSM